MSSVAKLRFQTRRPSWVLSRSNDWQKNKDPDVRTHSIGAIWENREQRKSLDIQTSGGRELIGGLETEEMKICWDSLEVMSLAVMNEYKLLSSRNIVNIAIQQSSVLAP